VTRVRDAHIPPTADPSNGWGEGIVEEIVRYSDVMYSTVQYSTLLYSTVACSYREGDGRREGRRREEILCGTAM
jgi:hypothetical protein